MKYNERLKRALKVAQVLEECKDREAQELREAYITAGYDPQVMRVGANVSCHTLNDRSTLFIVAGKIVHRSRNLTRRFLESGGAELQKRN